MKVLRAIQILNKDGMQTISSTYNEVDDQGNIIKLNVKDSFVAVDSTLQTHINAVEEYVRNRLNNQ